MSKHARAPIATALAGALLSCLPGGAVLRPEPSGPPAGLPRIAPARQPNPADARPSYAAYCRTVAAGCTGLFAQYASEEKCLERCRREGWALGRAGDTKGDSVGCRAEWASRAATDPAGSCAHAGVASPMCVVGEPLPTVPPLDPAATQVLGLYDGGDAQGWEAAGRRARKEILGERVRKALAARGLTLAIRDLRDGTPDDDETARSRAIVTALCDATLPGARGYLLWLRANMEAGRKVMILNDLGAFLEPGSPGGIGNEWVNLVFEPLGVEYRGSWTENGRVLRTTRADPTLFLRGRVPKASAAGHYYRFVRTGDDLAVFLEVERTDIPDSASPVVFAGRRGGFALARYYEDVDGREHVDLSKLLEVVIPSR
ncbi:MAG: hypothetical protein FJ087_04305 [Deltaproteobacteria bacterium]|nr:hypothetical protein [Deltaproteobacteria bacterium]